MSSKPSSGFTLPEMLIAIVVIGVGLAGVLIAFQTTVRGSADPLVQRQMLAVAEGLLEEALSKPFTALAGSGSGGCARDGFNDVDDYNGYVASGVCDVGGVAVSGLEGYAVNMTVTALNLSGVATKRVQVRVTRGSDSLQLVGHRSGYGA
jgi:MSHA pilin protein MshD